MARILSVNVIVVIGGILYELYSFDNVKEAEELFATLIREHVDDYSEDDMTAWLDNGHFEDQETDIYLSHSNMVAFAK